MRKREKVAQGDLPHATLYRKHRTTQVLLYFLCLLYLLYLLGRFVEP